MSSAPSLRLLSHSFIRVNRNLLADPRNCVGVWFVKEENIVYLDITTVLTDRNEAARLGKQYNQIGIYDFERAAVIETGGTGTEVAGLTLLQERLPALERTTIRENNTGDTGNDDT